MKRYINGEPGDDFRDISEKLRKHKDDLKPFMESLREEHVTARRFLESERGEKPLTEEEKAHAEGCEICKMNRRFARESMQRAGEIEQLPGGSGIDWTAAIAAEDNGQDEPGSRE